MTLNNESYGYELQRMFPKLDLRGWKVERKKEEAAPYKKATGFDTFLEA